jgi:hypothetical protein
VCISALSTSRAPQTIHTCVHAPEHANSRLAAAVAFSALIGQQRPWVASHVSSLESAKIVMIPIRHAKPCAQKTMRKHSLKMVRVPSVTQAEQSTVHKRRWLSVRFRVKGTHDVCARACSTVV